MNVNLYVIKEYENETALRLRKNKPKTNPISNATTAFLLITKNCQGPQLLTLQEKTL